MIWSVSILSPTTKHRPWIVAALPLFDPSDSPSSTAVAAHTCGRPLLQEEDQTTLFGLATNCTLELLRSQPPATATTTRSAEEGFATWDFRAAAASGTPREQERVEEEEEEAGDTAMPGEGSARMTTVETAIAEQTTKLPKPQEQAQKQKERGW